MNCVGPLRSTSPWYHQISWTIYKNYVVSSMPLVCWIYKMKCSTNICIWKASPSTSMLSKMPKISPSGKEIPSWLPPSSSSGTTPWFILGVYPVLTKAGRNSARIRRIGPPGKSVKGRLTEDQGQEAGRWSTRPNWGIAWHVKSVPSSLPSS